MRACTIKRCHDLLEMNANNHSWNSNHFMTVTKKETVSNSIILNYKSAFDLKILYACVCVCVLFYLLIQYRRKTTTHFVVYFSQNDGLNEIDS